jgi:predicted MFS family arabinose efflux permease
MSSFWFALALAPPAFANSAFTLGLALALLGLAAGAMDVSMNAQGVVVERLAQRPMMSGFHAAFSVGGMMGSGFGGLVAKRGMDVHHHFVWSAALYVLLVAIAVRGLVPAPADTKHGHHGLRLTPAIAGLGALSFCFFLSEGAVADWSALYLSKSLGAGPAQAAAGYALFSMAMALGRIAGDSLRSRFGAVSLVRLGSLSAAAGLVAALLYARTPLALAGFTMVGFGCSIIVPITFAAAGNLPGVSSGGALATVVAAGYFGLFAGPPLIGIAAEAISLRWALMIVVSLCLVGVSLSGFVRTSERKS